MRARARGGLAVRELWTGSSGPKVHLLWPRPLCASMSVEALALSVIVDEGASALRRFYGKGISNRDFVLKDDNA